MPGQAHKAGHDDVTRRMLHPRSRLSGQHEATRTHGDRNRSTELPARPRRAWLKPWSVRVRVPLRVRADSPTGRGGGFKTRSVQVRTPAQRTNRTSTCAAAARLESARRRSRSRLLSLAAESSAPTSRDPGFESLRRYILPRRPRPWHSRCPRSARIEGRETAARLARWSKSGSACSISV